MKVQEVLDLISQPAGSGKAKGALLFHQSAARRYTRTTSPAQIRLLNDLKAQGAPNLEGYEHPARRPDRTGLDRAGNLGPADLMWLDRLPRDPAQVPYDDARRVAGMASIMETRSTLRHSPNGRLVESIWAPIRDHHDGQAQQIVTRNEQQTDAPIPASALPALADAVSEESPNLDEASVLAWAGDYLERALNDRERLHQQRAAVLPRALRSRTTGSQARTR